MGGGEGREATEWETKQTHLIRNCTIQGKQTLQCQLENKEIAYTGKLANGIGWETVDQDGLFMKRSMT